MKSSVRLFLICSFLLTLFFVVNDKAVAATIRVPADHATIQGAINAAVNGDTVLVSPGTYFENINFMGKAITVTAEGIPQETIINGNQNGSVVTFESGEGLTSILNGFTLTNGLDDDFGGGMEILSSSPTITNNVFTGNSARIGGGMCLRQSSAMVRDNMIVDNFGSMEGGGISVIEGAPTISHNTVFSNTAAFDGAGIAVRFGAPLIERNTINSNHQPDGFSGGGGGGISVFGGIPIGSPSARIINNIIANNTHGLEGGGISLFAQGPQDLVISGNLIVKNSAFRGGGIAWTNPPASVVNNTIDNNDSPNGSGIHAVGFVGGVKVFNNIIFAKPGQTAVFCQLFSFASEPVFLFNNVFSPQGTAWGGDCPDQTGLNGNISADPLFVNPPMGIYQLKPGSPSIDAGSNAAPDLPPTDVVGNPRIVDGNGDGSAIIDQGAFEAGTVASQFDVCIQDDSNGNLFQFNSQTGDYRFSNCRKGFVLTGRGSVKIRFCKIELVDIRPDRSLNVLANTCTHAGSVSLQVSSQRGTFTVSDRDITNNTCACR